MADQPAPIHIEEELLLLEEPDALRRYIRHQNGRRFLLTMWALCIGMFILSLVNFISGGIYVGVIAALLFVADGLFLLLRKRSKLPWDQGDIQIFALLTHYLLILTASDIEGSVGWFFPICILSARFRFVGWGSVWLLGSLFLMLIGRVVVGPLIFGSTLVDEEIIGPSVVFIICLLVGIGHSRKLRRQFLGRWRHESKNYRERVRMKHELDHAREIQLSMLPDTVPELSWIDFSADSIPATEVGGDYYDYFVIGDDRIVVVVGDVTGHGVGSGIVLAGVRSSLNLLQEELIEPEDVLSRINDMLKQTTARHMYMTMAVALIDKGNDEVTVVTAGHPPVLVYRRNEHHELGYGALPLGAMNGTRYYRSIMKLEDDDIILVYSDGLVESINIDDQIFGWEGIHDVMRRVDEETSMESVKEKIIDAAAVHRGSTEQLDDLTVVAIRYGGQKSRVISHE